MGGYRVRSGQSLPNINTGSLPNLPKLGSLNKRPQAGSDEQTQAISLDDFEIPNDLGASGSADDILAAVGGIDGWDNIPDSAQASSSSGEISNGNLGMGALGDDVDDMEDDLTAVLESPYHQQTPSVDALPSPKAAISGTSLEGLPSPKVSDLPSVKMQNSGLPIPKQPGVELGHQGIDAMADPLPNLKPTINSSRSGAWNSSMDNSCTIAEGEGMQAIPEPVSEPVKPVIPVMPVTPSVTAPAASRPAPAPEPPKQPVANLSQPATAAPTQEKEMTDEEQFAEMLNSMTPEERAEYEAYCLEQQRQEAEARRAKQRELQEMYGVSSSINQKKSAPVGLIIGIIIVIGVFGGFIYWMLNSEDEAAVTQNETQAVEEVPVEPIAVRADPLNTYSVNIDTNGATLLYVNGVDTPIGGPYEFVTGHRNTVIAYADGMVPFIQSFDSKTNVTKVEVDLKPATHYLKGDLSFRVTDPALTSGGVKVTLDGHALSNFPSSDATDVVLGFPHILIIEKPGYAKHMHLIWPENSRTTVDIPALEAENTALLGTRCTVKKFPPSSKPFGIRIINGEQQYNSLTVATVLPGGIIEYYITREQRFPLGVSLIPEGFGTVSLDTALLRDSIGKSIVSFTKPDDSNMRVCMRRVGEVICPEMNGETVVPSGPDWVFIGLEGSDLSSRQMRGGQMQELQKDRKYKFEVGVNSSNAFVMRQTGYDRVKDGIK